jgi:hypothetical protein
MRRRTSTAAFLLSFVLCAALLYWALRYLPKTLVGRKGTLTDQEYRDAIASARTAGVQAVAAFLVLGTGLAAWTTALANRRSSTSTEEKGWSEGFERAAKLLVGGTERERTAGAHLLGSVGVASPAMRPAALRVLLESLSEALPLCEILPPPEEVLAVSALSIRLPHAAASLEEVMRLAASQKRERTILLRGLDLRAADLRSLSVTDCDFSGSLLDGLLASRARFSRCNFSRVRFSGAAGRNARFYRCSFSRATLRGFDLQRAVLVRCDLRSADLRRVDLLRSRLLFCDLRGADIESNSRRWTQRLLNRW